MEQLIQVGAAVLPVLVTLVIGLIVRQTKFIPPDGITAVKKIVLNITLPAVLFNAYLTIDFNGHALIIFLTMFLACGAALALGILIRKWLKINRPFFPYLMPAFEVGMIGYALYSLLFGAEKINLVAVVDLGQVTFVFTVYMSILYLKNDPDYGIKDALRNMVTSPVFLAIVLGTLLGVTGLNRTLLGSATGQLLIDVIAFIGAPTAGAILIVVGYELNLSRQNLRDAGLACLSRFLILAAVCALVLGLFKLLIPVSTEFFWAVVLVFSLPPVYVLPMFVKDDRENEYISTTISLYTLLTIIIFLILALIVRS